MEHSQHLLELREVTKTYRTQAGEFTALDGVDFTIEPGEYIGIVGKSGSGKSTLLNLVTGIDRPSAGGIFSYGQPLASMSEEDLSLWRGRSVGIVFQFFQLLPTLTVLENIILPMDFCGKIPSRDRGKRAGALLEEIGIAPLSRKFPSELSGGEQQRAAIARALANDPEIIVADEPTGNLDTKTTADMYALFDRLSASGKTLLIVSHDRDITTRVRRIIVIADGKIVRG